MHYPTYTPKAESTATQVSSIVAQSVANAVYFHILSTNACTKGATTKITWGSIGTTVFVDNLYLSVSQPHETVAGIRYPGVPKSIRNWIRSQIGNCAVSLVRTQVTIEGTRFTLDCKTHNLPLEKVLEFALLLEVPKVMEDGTQIALVNVDFTRNVPGAVVTLENPGPISLNGLQYFPKDNRKYVGDACHTFTQGETREPRESNARYVMDYQEEEGRVAYTAVAGRDYKLYDKTRFHCETTTARGSTGNGLEHLFRSTHNDIQEAVLDRDIQENGHGRIEVRCNPGYVPRTVEAVWAMLELFYNGTQHLRVVKPVREIVGQYTANPSLLVILRDLRGVGQPLYTPTIVRSLSRETGNTNSETLKQATTDLGDVAHFVANTAVPGKPIYVCLVDWDASGVHVTSDWEIPAYRSEMDRISPVYIPVGTRHNKNSKTYTQEETGLQGICYQLKTRPDPTTWDLELVEQGKSDPIIAVSQKEKARKKWFKEVERVVAHVMAPQKKPPKLQAFSRVPSTPVCVVRVSQNQGTYQLQTITGELYRDNSKIRSGLSVGMPPFILQKGRKTGEHKGHPVYGNAKIELVTPETPAYGFLLWGAEDYDRYAHLELPR